VAALALSALLIAGFGMSYRTLFAIFGMDYAQANDLLSLLMVALLGCEGCALWVLLRRR
jgi:hypothetical protein